MVVEDQHELIAFLSDAASYPADERGADRAHVERIETHSAAVFLIGEHAYKLKRAVRYDYLDFSSLDRRRLFCEAEVALNRRSAPHLYLGVVPVTREADGTLAIGGTGAPVDWLVHMRRFEEDQLLDRLAARGRLSRDLMPRLAGAIARLHADARPCEGRTGVGAMRWVVDGNARGFLDDAAGLLDRTQCRRVIAMSHVAIDAHASLLNARSRAGWIRQCHGDLHLGNLVMIDGAAVPFDAVEFNDDISCIDVLYDLSFLLMDLWRLKLDGHANALFNHYVGIMFARDDCEALALFPLFLSCRSAVRAKTCATASRLQREPAHAGALAADARVYMTEAERMLHPPRPTLLAIGGLSGSGKSTMARAVASSLGPPPGALIVRSDGLRKRLAGVEDLVRLGADAYTPAMHARVYGELGEWTWRSLAAGHSVVADAVFGTEAERRAIEAVASRCGAAFAGVWLDAAPGVLSARVTARQHDASDATAEVVAQQVARGAGDVRWPLVDANAAPDVVERRVRTALQRML